MRRAEPEAAKQRSAAAHASGRHPPCGLSGLAFVFESVAVASDLHDARVVQQLVEHPRCQRLVLRKGYQLRERQVARGNHRTALVALGHDVEEQVRLVVAEGRVADLVDHQQLRAEHRPAEVVL